jgi:hypothetical protein
MAAKGYEKYTTKYGEDRFSSKLIVNRKPFHLASHLDKETAIKAHLKAKELIKSHSIVEVQHMKNFRELILLALLLLVGCCDVDEDIWVDEVVPMKADYLAMHGDNFE